MKKRLGVFVVLALLALPTQAQNWTGATNNFWSLGSNWTGGIAPPNSPSDVVTFPGTALSFTPNLDGGKVVNTMTVSGAGYSFSGSQLNFANPGAALTVSQPGSSMS